MSDLELEEGKLWLEYFAVRSRNVLLHHIYVDPSLRGYGLGTQLLLYMQRQFDTILLAPVPDRAVRFDVVEWYERHGFRWSSMTHRMMEWHKC
jgi:GNAT superfamily N-acetyltransferase